VNHISSLRDTKERVKNIESRITRS
jgi:hypothetical protein